MTPAQKKFLDLAPKAPTYDLSDWTPEVAAAAQEVPDAEWAAIIERRDKWRHREVVAASILGGFVARGIEGEGDASIRAALRLADALIAESRKP